MPPMHLFQNHCQNRNLQSYYPTMLHCHLSNNHFVFRVTVFLRCWHLHITYAASGAIAPTQMTLQAWRFA